MITDFDSLAQAIADYGKAPELLATIKETFIPLVNVRLGRDLDSSANELTAELDPETAGGWPIELPADFSRVRSVVYNNRWALHARGNSGFYTIEEDGGDPLIYNIRDGAIDVRPRAPGTYAVNYYAIPTLSADPGETTNDILKRHPQLYLYGGLIELYVFTMDRENRILAEDYYSAEARAINRAERRGRASAPQAIGI